jgi:4a-hydroxytetrahydrobiopterin dehydratase
MHLPSSPEHLRTRACTPLTGRDGLDATAIDAQLAVLPRWSVVDGALQASFGFTDWWETIAFVNALAWMVHAQDHHPDLAVGYDRCTVRWTTHSAGGITVNDFICAARTDAVHDARPGR